MFTTPAVDPVPLADALGERGGFGAWKSRVRGLPEFGGELPVAALAEEIETPGDGQIRALVTLAGNPVLSTPNGPRLERALGGLDFMVVDRSYLNETTRHAHVILPPSSPLERESLRSRALRVRGAQRREVLGADPRAPPPSVRHDWEICCDLAARLCQAAARRGASALAERALGARARGDARSRCCASARTGSSLRSCAPAPHGIDLGPLEPRLPERLGTRDKTVAARAALFLADLPRLERAARGAERRRLVLIGRRQLRSNNSWMHNSQRLVKGPPRARCSCIPTTRRRAGSPTATRAQVATARRRDGGAASRSPTR